MTRVPDKSDIALLRAEVEMLMAERERLLRAVGAAAALYARVDPKALPERALPAAEILTESLNGVGEELLQEAIEQVESDVQARQSAQRHGDGA